MFGIYKETYTHWSERCDRYEDDLNCNLNSEQLTYLKEQIVNDIGYLRNVRIISSDFRCVIIDRLIEILKGVEKNLQNLNNIEQQN